MLTKILILSILIACSGENSSKNNSVNKSPGSQHKGLSTDLFAYALGVQYARGISELELSAKQKEKFLAGIKDQFENKVRLPNETIQVQAKKVDQILTKKRAKIAALKKQEGEAFVAKLLSADKGYRQSSSGLVYKIAEQGKIVSSPASNALVMLSYRGYHLDDTPYEQSILKKPKKLPFAGIMKAWQEAFQLAGSGGAITIIAPPELTYGDSGARPHIEPGEYLKFHLKFYGLIQE